MSSEWTETRREKRDGYWLGELLACIHGDGGQYQEEHGTEKAVRDALAKIYHARKERDRLATDLERVYAQLEQMVTAGQVEAEAERQRQEQEFATEEDTDMAKSEKSTQKGDQGYPHTCIYGPKSGGNPTQGGGINRPTKGKG